VLKKHIGHAPPLYALCHRGDLGKTPTTSGSIMSARFPGVDENALLVRDEAVEADMAHVFGVIFRYPKHPKCHEYPPIHAVGCEYADHGCP